PPDAARRPGADPRGGSRTRPSRPRRGRHTSAETGSGEASRPVDRAAVAPSHFRLPGTGPEEPGRQFAEAEVEVPARRGGTGVSGASVPQEVEESLLVSAHPSEPPRPGVLDQQADEDLGKLVTQLLNVSRPGEPRALPEGVQP